MKSLLNVLLLILSFLPLIASAQEVNSKFPIYFDFRLNEPADGVDVQQIINEVEAAPGGLFVHSSDIRSSKIAIHITNEIISSRYHYVVWVNAFDEEFNADRESPKFEKFIELNDRTHLATVVKIILNLATVYSDFEQGAPGIPGPSDPTEAAKDRRWVFDIGVDGSFDNSGNESMNGAGSVMASGTGIYKHFKSSFAGLGKYTYTKAPSPYGTFKGGSYVAFVENAMVFNLKEAGSKKDHWNIGLVTTGYVMPFTKNIDYQGMVDLGAEWVMFPVYDDTQNKNIIIRAGFSGVYNDYHIQTASQKMHEAYGEAFMKFYFVRYAKQGRFKAVMGTDVRFRLDQPKFGSYKLTGGISYAINQHVSFNANFSVSYRPESLMYPNNFDDDERMAYFYNAYPGFSSEENIGFSFNLGNVKSIIRKKRNQRWVNPTIN